MALNNSLPACNNKREAFNRDTAWRTLKSYGFQFWNLRQNSRTLSRMILYGLFLIIFFILIGCSRKHDKLQIGLIAPSTNHLPVLIALEEGLLDEDELKIHWFSSGWEVNEALISGRVDLAIMPFTYAWQGVAERQKVRILSFLERESDGIIARREIETVRDLDGRKVGVLRASTLDIFFHLVIDSYNIEPEIVYFRTPTEMAAALNTGHVDALSFYVPPMFQFDNRFKPLLWYSELYPEHPCCDLVAYEESLSEKEDLIFDFLRVIEKSCNIMQKENNKGISLIIDHFGYERTIAEKTLEQQKFITGLNEEGIKFQKKVVNKMLDLGYLRKEVSTSDVYYDIHESR